jgi:3(or 17)beta-hydroxysteroid dehydrogenase
MMNRVKGKVAIITGAATGIGRVTAQLLAQEGAKVVVTTDANIKGAEETVASIKAAGGEAIFIQQDITNEDDWKTVIEKTLKTYGRIDVLVNNAGIMIAKEIENTTLEEWRRVMKVNLDGVFLGTKYGIGAMKKTGGGSIINMSSVLGLVGNFDHTSAYSASKGGIRLFTKAAAVECSKGGLNYNIRVNSVHPGVIETPMATPVFSNEEFRKAMERYHPIGRLGNPIDVAYGVLYLASDESSFITGTELVIDGGCTAH